MNIRDSLRIFIPAIAITVLVCGGIYLYTQRDLNRFRESLGELPAVSQPTTYDHTPEQPTSEVPTSTASEAESFEQDTHEDSTLMDTPLFSSESEHVHDSHVHTHDDHGDTHDTDLSEGGFFNEDVDIGETHQRRVTEGFNEYNDYLTSDPERAYASLAQALRDRYGDHPDMDAFVETIRQTNEGTLTLDDAIWQMDVFNEILSQAGQERPSLRTFHQDLLDLKELQEMGEIADVQIEYQFLFVGD